MIKFNRYNKAGKLRILIPPYKLEDFDSSLNDGRQVMIYGGYRMYKNLLNNQIYFYSESRYGPALLSISDEDDWPSKRDKTFYRIWFPTKIDLEKFKKEMGSRILSEDFMFDPKNSGNFKKVEVESKWSYYVVKYD